MFAETKTGDYMCIGYVQVFNAGTEPKEFITRVVYAESEVDAAKKFRELLNKKTFKSVFVLPPL
jgi:hypothetical protein